MSGYDLSVVIVNYNGASFLPECLESLFSSQTQAKFEVIVVDNASTDNSKTLLQDSPHPLQLIFNDQNWGFGVANNQGVAQAFGNYIFLLNNDTKLFPNTLETLWQFCKKTKLLGAVSPQLLNADQSIQGQGSVLGHWQFHTPKVKTVSFLAGAALMMKKEVFLEMGGFDEHFFFYNEDLDLCKTLLKKGYKLYYYPQSQLIHYGGLSTQSRKAKAIIEGYRGGLYLAYKHYPHWIYQLYRLLLLIDILPKILYYKFNNADYFNAYWAILQINKNQILSCKKGIPSTLKEAA